MLQLLVITKSWCDKSALWHVTTVKMGLHHIKTIWEFLQPAIRITLISRT